MLKDVLVDNTFQDLADNRRIEIGLKFEGTDISVDLGIGTTRAIFHASGKLPVDSDRLKRRVRLGVIEVAVPLSILADISSGPEDLLPSSLVIDDGCRNCCWKGAYVTAWSNGN